MGNISTRLKFSRCREVMSSRGVALVHLREREFVRGEPAIVNYYENSSVNSSINTIVAVGIKNGKGKDCFRVVTLGQYEIVWGISDILPDVTSLIHDELYLWRNPMGVWHYVSAPDGRTRTIEPILPMPHIYLNLDDNMIYVSDEDRQVRKISDVYTKSEIDDLLATISGGDFSSLSNLEKRINEVYDSVQEVIARNNELVDIIEGMNASIDAVDDLTDRVEALEEKTAGLEVDQNGNISGSFSEVIFVGGETVDVTINKENVVTRDNIDDCVTPAEAIPIEILNGVLR